MWSLLCCNISVLVCQSMAPGIGVSDPTKLRRRPQEPHTSSPMCMMHKHSGPVAEADGNRTRQGTFAPSPVLKTGGRVFHYRSTFLITIAVRFE